MKYEIGAMVEAKSGSLTNWYEGQIVGYDDTNDIYVLHMCEEYPFTPYAGFSEDRIREVFEPTVVHVVLNSPRISMDDITLHTEQNLEDAQIEAKAEELYEIYSDKYQTALEQKILCGWMNQSEHLREGFRAIARHLATPQTDVQKALGEALHSERELMDILRKIGKVFGKNVGTDIGILDLPKLVEGMVCENEKLHFDARKAASELEAHKHNSKQMLRLNNWLREHNLTKPGVRVTDTIIELLEGSVKPKQPDEPRVSVNDNCVCTYEQLRDAGWTEEQMVAHGYAKWLPRKPEPAIRQDHRLPPEYVRILQSFTGCKVKTEMDGTSEEDMMLLQKMIDNYARLRDIEANYRELSERVAEAYTYIPADL